MKAFLFFVILSYLYESWSLWAGYSGPGLWAFVEHVIDASMVGLVVCFLLFAIGDVSGKGLQAALTVSLVVGLWKEMTAHSSSPADMLARLNQQLAGSLKGGFVTCLCACLTAEGRLTLANAGHLAPYRNGKELVTINGLPLGISAASEYEESHHLLTPTDTLVFVSDGVVEARDKGRTLFGFDRLHQALSEHPNAEALARRAQQFGQED